MLKIVKDNDIKIVTKGAYENLYKSFGYILYEEKKPTVTTKVDKTDSDMGNEIAKKTSSVSTRTRKTRGK